MFYSAIKTTYPTMNIIANTTVPSQPMDILDEHYYRRPDGSPRRTINYDTYSRTGPKIFVGEYASLEGDRIWATSRAVWARPCGCWGWSATLMSSPCASYAPLFINVNNRAWSPDLIDFDATVSYGIPSYYVEKVLFNNRGNVNLSTTSSGPTKPMAMVTGGIGLGTWTTASEYGDVLVMNGTTTLCQSNFPAARRVGPPDAAGTWSVVNGNLQQTNATVADCRDYYYSPSWTDYTLTLKPARCREARAL